MFLLGVFIVLVVLAGLIAGVWLFASKATAKTTIVLLCIATLTVCTTLLIGRIARGTRVADLTEQNLYTLNKGTLNIIGNIKDPITLKLYYSKVAAEKGPKEIQFWNQYQYYVRDILDEYVSRSNGKLKLEIIDPRPYTDEEEQAQTAGVKRFRLNADESFYFGLAATNQYGKSKAIEFFEPERQELVEYDLSKLIFSLTQMEKRKVGVLSALPVMGPDNMSPYMAFMLRQQGQQVPDPWTIIRQLGLNYDVVKAVVKEGAIGSETRNDTDMGMSMAPQSGTFTANLDFLIVIHPKNLDEPSRFAIDQFVMKGGKLLIMEDPCCFSDQPQRDNPYGGNEGRSQASDLNDLTAAWGLTMRSNTMAVDRSLAAPDESGGPLLPSLILDDNCTNKKEIIASDLHTVRLFASGVLEKTGKGTGDISALLETSAKGSATWSPAGPIDPRMASASDMVSQALLPAQKPLMLAAIIRGKLATNFPNGITLPPPQEEPKDPAAPKPASAPASKPAKHLQAHQQSPENAAVVVIADVDMINDQMAYQKSFFGMSQVGDNASLVLNALDFLAGQKDLISIRSRGKYSRPFKKVDEIERTAVASSEEEIKKFNNEIRAYEQQLQELGEGATEKDVKVISGEKLAKRNEILGKKKDIEKKLRGIQAGRREKVEELKWWVQFWNLGGAPTIILIIAIALAILRWAQAETWASRSNGQ